MRRGASLIELIVCLAIIGTMVSLLLPAVSKVRATAQATACQNNLRQIALGIHNYHDTNRHLPYPRECPAPWNGGRDPICSKITSPVQFTGPNEVWWCPYDNRPGATPTAALNDYRPNGSILPFVERNVKVFRCPEGFDRTPGSPNQGHTFQVSYALVPEISGRRLGEYEGAILMEHDDAPFCTNAAAHYTPWSADAATKSVRHSPHRHTGTLSIARHDGSVSIRK